MEERDKIGSFPSWEVHYNEVGDLRNPVDEGILCKEIQESKISDLFIFAHGWNNDARAAKKLYNDYFALMFDVFEEAKSGMIQPPIIGTLSVFWPSRDVIYWRPLKRFFDPLASAEVVEPSWDILPELRHLVSTQQQHSLLDELEQVLTTHYSTEDQLPLARIQAVIQQIASTSEGSSNPEDDIELLPLRGDPDSVFEGMANLAVAQGPPLNSVRDSAAAISIGNLTAKLGIGATLDRLYFWLNKKRAGVVGQKGLGRLIRSLTHHPSELHVHLLGHSLGARLVCYSLLDRLASAQGQKPVKSVVLLQGAFSNAAFAERLPFDESRHGALYGVADNVGGPLVATYSMHDAVLRNAYALSQWAKREDGATIGDKVRNTILGKDPRFDAVGYIGFRGVNVTTSYIVPSGTQYELDPQSPLTRGSFVNINGDDLIRDHGDILRRPLAWLTLTAAGCLADST